MTSDHLLAGILFLAFTAIVAIAFIIFDGGNSGQ